jgi:HEAT repeat protein
MDTVAQICEQLGSPDQVKAFQARRALGLRVTAAGAPGKEAERTALAAELAACLVAKAETKDGKDKKDVPPRYADAARNEICRALADVGGDAEVPALVQTLADFQVREMARFALARIPTAAAAAALGDAAQKSVGVEFRVGVINALASRKDAAAASALKQAAADSSIEVRLAAAEALAQQPDAAGDALIVQAEKELGPTSPRAAKRMNVARLRLAATLAKAGQKDAARGIYQGLVSDGADEAQKKAAKSALEQLG